MDSDKRVLIGMSGGIDSSAACMILQEQGYEVIGLTMRMWDLPRHFPNEGQTIPQFAIEAKELAEKIGIEHHILDVRDDFKRTVIKSFTDEYLKGNTPNPCVLCNKQFKWHYLLQEANRLNCQWVATGHYARISRKNNRFILNRGADPKKDQSYFLWRLGQQELARTIFPLGDITKEEIKQYVEKKGFHEKVEKKESMEVCFIPGDYRDFLREQLPNLDREVAGGFYRCRRTETRTAQRIPILYHRAAQRIGDSFGEAHVRHPHKSDKKHDTVGRTVGTAHPEYGYYRCYRNHTRHSEYIGTGRRSNSLPQCGYTSDPSQRRNS